MKVEIIKLEKTEELNNKNKLFLLLIKIIYFYY
jgi:hypothetical protein